MDQPGRRWPRSRPAIPCTWSHEYLAKVAIETCDGVLVHSLLGALKPGDIPAEVRTPREALRHALFRQNYGCSLLIVGRDHAGVGSYS